MKDNHTLSAKTKVAVLLTSFNRKDQTKKCIISLADGNPSLDLRFVITDDNSSDGTGEMLHGLTTERGYHIHLIEGDGSLFWAGGMRKSLGYALNNADKFDYALLVNDDVEFFEGAIESLIKRLQAANAHCIAGATCDDSGNISYGPVNKQSNFFAKFSLVEPGSEVRECDTFNCNCVLICAEVFAKLPNIDSHFTHSMGDFDYGLTMKKLGYRIINPEDYCGKCQDNDITNTWRNKKLSRKERLKLKESPKGLPRKDWAYFVRKNFGFISAVYHTMTPYIRILIGI